LVGASSCPCAIDNKGKRLTSPTTINFIHSFIFVSIIWKLRV
jgi:hypothetical protein